MANPRPIPQWKPGQSGNPGGKPKKLLRRLEEVMHSRGIDPVDELLDLIPRLPEMAQAKVWLDLISYLHAKPKANEIEMQLINPIDELSTKEILKIVEEKYPEIKREVG